MRTFVLFLVAGSLGGGGAVAGDLRQPLGSGQLRPSISRPSLMQEYGVPASRSSPQPQPQGGLSPPSTAGAGWPTAPTGDASVRGSPGSWTYPTTGTASGAVPGAGPAGGASGWGAGGVPLGEGERAVVRRAMGLDARPAAGSAADAVPAGSAAGEVVRKAMGVNDVPGAAAAEGAATPGFAAGEVVRNAMGIGDSGTALPAKPGDSSDTAAGASGDASSGKDGSGTSEKPRPRPRAPAPPPRRPTPDRGYAVDWDTMRSALRTGVSSVLGWIGGY